MVTLNNESSTRQRVILRAVSLGLVALVVASLFGAWKLGLVLAAAVMVGSLIPPFSHWPRRR